MNSEWVEPPKDQAKTGLATPGAQLKEQREALGLSVEQIADQLKLAPRQVVALEAGDYASLPNMAVTRGFVRAYAKVVRIDATPLVAMIEVRSPTSPEVSPPRKEIAATFSDTRMPLMKSRHSHTGAWVMGGVAVVVVVGGIFLYQSGLIAHTLALFERGADSAAVATEPAKTDTTVAPLETTLVKPGQETAALQSPNVPLVSVPPVDGGGAANAGTVAGVAPAPAAAGTVATPATAPVNTPAPTVNGQPATTAATSTAPAAATAATPVAAASLTGTALVLKVTEDSWVEIRRPGAAPLISRVVKAGSTETFDIKGPSLLIVGKPAGVQASLGGAPLALPQIAGGTIARVNIK
ncbi:cytoskeleton protein RodZ [Duganella sp. 3397]|uniref:RodZ domain-containing protein n=1 Tax=Duganella sp. 3397 TaxID=2817732 RepID=UPI00285B3758|nr:RodZ domain-containing protein [Duganella sp. 3397]MDR7049919.1 cytoskeleton protein RodZ [Duganella sp. 3397]